jgi:hypothetical protein
MSLLEKIKSDSLAARKSRTLLGVKKDKTDDDQTALFAVQLTAELLVTLSSEATMVGKNAGHETTDGETIAVIQKFVKSAKDTFAALADDDTRRGVIALEIEILTAYLPQQLSEDEIKAAVESILAGGVERTKKSVGIVMKELKAKYDGQYDGKLASAVVNAALS